MSDRDEVHDRVVDNFNAAMNNVLDTMTPKRMLQHLTGTDWRFVREVHAGAGQVWILYRGREVRASVMVPTRLEDADFRMQMRVALRTVLVAEDWPMALTMALIFPPDLR